MMRIRSLRAIYFALCALACVAGCPPQLDDGVVTPEEIATVAGTGEAGFSGDGGLAHGDGISATQAQLSNPSGLFVTDHDEVFIADTGNHRIRRFTYSSTP